MRRGFLARKSAPTPALQAVLEAVARREGVPAMGTDVWLCPGDHGDVTSKRVSESETGRIGEVVAFDADASKGIVSMATGTMTDVRPITPSECRPCVVRP